MDILNTECLSITGCVRNVRDMCLQKTNIVNNAMPAHPRYVDKYIPLAI